MILADKIIALRRKNGWSQEELAEKMLVSRQAVSKWEGAQTVPDLEKILVLSRLFGVTTDYLLKDELEEEEFAEEQDRSPLKKVSLERIFGVAPPGGGADCRGRLSLRRRRDLPAAVGRRDGGPEASPARRLRRRHRTFGSADPCCRRRRDFRLLRVQKRALRLPRQGAL